MNQRQILEHFERLTATRPTQACRLLGIDYRRWNEYKKGHRDLKPYHKASIAAHLLLSPDALERRKQDTGL